jgi:hypothetical protein
MRTSNASKTQSKTHFQLPEQTHPLRRLFKRLHAKRAAVALATTLITASAVGGFFYQPASAQGLSYWPWAIGSSLMYPMRYLSYGMGGMYGGYGGMYGNYNYSNNGNGYSPYGNPGYTNMGWYNGSILQRATRGLGGPGYNGYSATGNPNFANVNDNAQAYTPPPNVMKYGGAYPTANQSTSTNQAGTPDANAIYPNNAAGTPATNGSAANFSNSNYPSANYGGMQYPGGQQGPGNYMSGVNGMNSVNSQNGMNGQYSYTDRHGRIKYKKNKNQPSNNQSGQPGNGSAKQGAGAGGPGAGSGTGSGITSTSTAPFAGAFINNVNSEYQGDIRKAMSNPQTRAWAQSLGVTNNGNNNFAISDERSGVIEHVLKDSSLDPVSKLDAIKILMRN